MYISKCFNNFGREWKCVDTEKEIFKSREDVIVLLIFYLFSKTRQIKVHKKSNHIFAFLAKTFLNFGDFWLVDSAESSQSEASNRQKSLPKRQKCDLTSFLKISPKTNGLFSISCWHQWSIQAPSNACPSFSVVPFPNSSTRIKVLPEELFKALDIWFKSTVNADKPSAIGKKIYLFVNSDFTKILILQHSGPENVKKSN